jgi:hypothetical protein
MWLFFLFLAVSLVLTIFGFTSDLPVFTFVGTIMLFLLGGLLLGSGIEYKVGENVTITTDDQNVTTQQYVDVYATYDDAAGNRFGWFLLILGALSFVLALYML